jgi:hypothetical protein
MTNVFPEDPTLIVWKADDQYYYSRDNSVWYPRRRKKRKKSALILALPPGVQFFCLTRRSVFIRFETAPIKLSSHWGRGAGLMKNVCNDGTAEES